MIVHFNKSEISILKLLFSERRPMSINEISKTSKISWVTVRKYLIRLNKKGYITKHDKYEFNFDSLEKSNLY